MSVKKCCLVSEWVIHKMTHNDIGLTPLQIVLLVGCWTHYTHTVRKIGASIIFSVSIASSCWAANCTSHKHSCCAPARPMQHTPLLNYKMPLHPHLLIDLINSLGPRRVVAELVLALKHFAHVVLCHRLGRRKGLLGKGAHVWGQRGGRCRQKRASTRKGGTRISASGHAFSKGLPPQYRNATGLWSERASFCEMPLPCADAAIVQPPAVTSVVFFLSCSCSQASSRAGTSAQAGHRQCFTEARIVRCLNLLLFPPISAGLLALQRQLSAHTAARHSHSPRRPCRRRRAW